MNINYCVQFSHNYIVIIAQKLTFRNGLIISPLVDRAYRKTNDTTAMFDSVYFVNMFCPKFVLWCTRWCTVQLYNPFITAVIGKAIHPSQNHANFGANIVVQQRKDQSRLVSTVRKQTVQSWGTIFIHVIYTQSHTVNLLQPNKLAFSPLPSLETPFTQLQDDFDLNQDALNQQNPSSHFSPMVHTSTSTHMYLNTQTHTDTHKYKILLYTAPERACGD